MINDIIRNSENVNDIRMSAEVAEAMQGLRKFMFQTLYVNPVAKSEEVKARKMLIELYEYYRKNIDELPENYLRFIREYGEKPERVICDYIAGMTDRYCISKFEDIFVPLSWKV
jgi:dGTPase